MVDTDEGSVRIIFSDADETVRNTIEEYPTEALDISTDPRQQLIQSKSVASVGEDDKITLSVKLVAASSIDYGLSQIRIPVTVKNLGTGVVYEKTLRHADFAVADTVVSAANTWTVVGSYTVPPQQRIKLGWNIVNNSRVYILLTESA